MNVHKMEPIDGLHTIPKVCMRVPNYACLHLDSPKLSNSRMSTVDHGRVCLFHMLMYLLTLMEAPLALLLHRHPSPTAGRKRPNPTSKLLCFRSLTALHCDVLLWPSGSLAVALQPVPSALRRLHSVQCWQLLRGVPPTVCSQAWVGHEGVCFVLHCTALHSIAKHLTA